MAEAKKRSKRQAGHNSKMFMKVKICVRYLGNKSTGMSIVDVGIFSGFVPDDEDLKRLEKEPEHEIERYEKSKKGVFLYLKKIPNDKPYCFDFRVSREYIVGDTQRSSVKVYDYYNPDEACTTFYSPPSKSAILHKLCDGGVCQCAEGGCPPSKPFEIIKSFEKSERRKQLRHIACENYDYVWKGQVVNDVNQQNGFFNISFEIDQVIKEGIEKKELTEGEVRHFLLRDNCTPLMKDETYLIMGKDGEKYKNEQGQIWHRYIMDQTSAVHMWTSIKTASDQQLQRILNSVVEKLEKDGCLE